MQQQGQINPVRTFHGLVCLYLLLLSAAVLSDSDAVKLLANALAIGLFVVAGINWAFIDAGPRPAPGYVWGLLLFVTGMVGSLLFAGAAGDAVDALKIGLAPCFVLFGFTFERYAQRWSLAEFGARVGWWLMLLAPLLVWLFQLATLGWESRTERGVGIFANANNAGLYAFTLLAFYSVLAGQTLRQPWLFLALGLAFGTLGLLLAACAAMVISHGRWRILLGAAVAAGVLLPAITALPELSRTLRVQPVVDSLALLLSGQIDLANVTYGELVARLGTSDLSFLFRLKHWVDLLGVYADAAPVEWLFGLGVGASVRLSRIHLVPHNDYLRLLFEFGLLAFAGFVTLLATLIRSLGRGWSLVPFLTIVLYFFSENLINNYIAMVLFFYAAGALSARRRAAESKAADA